LKQVKEGEIQKGQIFPTKKKKKEKKKGKKEKKVRNEDWLHAAG